MSLSRPEAILFDWDNTLVDTWPTIHVALNHTLREMNHPEWSLQQVKDNVKKSMRDSFPEMFGDNWEHAAQLYQNHYRSIHLQSLAALPNAEEIIAYLKDKPVFVAVVSNKRGENLRKEIDHLGWSGYFDAIVGADDAAFDKPHPAPVELALSKSGIEPGEHVWFIGDTIIDLECAKNTGTTPLLYGDVETDEAEYLGFPFRHHARDHERLLGLLKQFFEPGGK